MNKDYFIGKYLLAKEERNALEEGTLTAEETAGYWLYEASHGVREEFTRMLKNNDIVLSQDKFYAEVNTYLKESGY